MLVTHLLQLHRGASGAAVHGSELSIDPEGTGGEVSVMLTQPPPSPLKVETL